LHILLGRKESDDMQNAEMLRKQVIDDCGRMTELIRRYVAGERSVKVEMDRQEKAIKIKMAVLGNLVEVEAADTEP
jgi:hypothetical protein